MYPLAQENQTARFFSKYIEFSLILMKSIAFLIKLFKLRTIDDLKVYQRHSFYCTHMYENDK